MGCLYVNFAFFFKSDIIHINPFIYIRMYIALSRCHRSHFASQPLPNLIHQRFRNLQKVTCRCILREFLKWSQNTGDLFKMRSVLLVFILVLLFRAFSLQHMSSFFECTLALLSPLVVDFLQHMLHYSGLIPQSFLMK